MKKLVYALPLLLWTAPAFADNRSDRGSGREQEPRAALSSQWRGGSEVDRILSRWPETPRGIAEDMIEKYGRADEAGQDFLLWRNNGPWEMTILLREPVTHNWPQPHSDYLQQFVRMRVPTDKFDDIAAFDGSVIVDRTPGLVSARCGGEPMNFLALNLANDIATGKKSTQEARKFYERIALSDEQSPYTEKLNFSTRGSTADPGSEARGAKSKERKR